MFQSRSKDFLSFCAVGTLLISELVFLRRDDWVHIFSCYLNKHSHLNLLPRTLGMDPRLLQGL